MALLLGRRDAPGYFDLSPRGFIGSLVAVVLAITLTGFAPHLFGMSLPAGAATQSVIVNVVLFLAQAGTSYLALRQMGRQDGFLPFLTASNWVTLFSAILVVLSSLTPLSGLVLIGVMVMAIVTFVNIGRLVVTLTGWQIGILFLAQTVGVFIAIGIMMSLIGTPTI
ncbi:MAG: hypothetical protein ABS76_04500 [Pelagibacterium sp. SCN 64-44]|nr:MAG: hypothetical protein ABS76_04500 [Pelagibacterium sp. SCN 64-44]